MPAGQDAALPWQRQPLTWLAAVLLALLLWASLSPLRYPSREKLIELGGAQAVPSAVRLTLGVQDVLLLRNNSPLPHVFGQLRVLPGHIIRLPFEQVADLDFACSAHPRGQVQVHVVAPPDPGLARLRWRVDGLIDALRYLPTVAPRVS
jgi:hypothetical protein